MKLWWKFSAMEAELYMAVLPPDKVDRLLKEGILKGNPIEEWIAAPP